MIATLLEKGMKFNDLLQCMVSSATKETHVNVPVSSTIKLDTIYKGLKLSRSFGLSRGITITLSLRTHSESSSFEAHGIDEDGDNIYNINDFILVEFGNIKTQCWFAAYQQKENYNPYQGTPFKDMSTPQQHLDAALTEQQQYDAAIVASLATSQEEGQKPKRFTTRIVKSLVIQVPGHLIE